MVNKATIYYQEDANDKDLTQSIEVMFNPASYTLSRNVGYNDAKNDENPNNTNNATTSTASLQNYPPMSFTGGKLDTLSMELMLNKYEFEHYSGDVTYNSRDLNVVDDVRKLKALTFIQANQHKPPMCKFSWSSFEFKGYITSLNVEYTMFLDDGTPVRAKVSLSMSGAEVGTEAKISFESPDRTKNKLIQENKQLWELAYEEYSDASQWREIAKANNINNPLYLQSGTRLVIPALTK